ncbi:MAG: IPTL-CTERM sorting domain-containing protein, partial [Pseudomonadota bacterium]
SQNSASVSATQFHNRTVALTIPSAGNYEITFKIDNMGSGFHAILLDNVTLSALAPIPAPEPTNHPTSFTATADNGGQITTTWTDSIGANLPSGYLISCSRSSPLLSLTDGNPEDDAEPCVNEGIKNVAYGVQTYAWTGLDSNIEYNFMIYPFSNSASSIDYKTDGVPSGASATTPADDGDGVDSDIESAVPDADGEGTGDGNNDGTQDTDQAHVSSLKTNDGNNYVTLHNTNTLNLTAVSAGPSPEDLPAGVTFPYDMISFKVNAVAPGATVTMDIYYPYNPAINGFWKKGTDDGNWYNIATSISHIGTTKTKITINLVEGGNFDTDNDPTTLTDPAGAGIGANAIPTLSRWMLILLSLILVFFAALKIKSLPEM